MDARRCGGKARPSPAPVLGQPPPHRPTPTTPPCMRAEIPGFLGERGLGRDCRGPGCGFCRSTRSGCSCPLLVSAAESPYESGGRLRNGSSGRDCTCAFPHPSRHGASSRHGAPSRHGAYAFPSGPLPPSAFRVGLVPTGPSGRALCETGGRRAAPDGQSDLEMSAIHTLGTQIRPVRVGRRARLTQPAFAAGRSPAGNVCRRLQRTE